MKNLIKIILLITLFTMPVLGWANEPLKVGLAPLFNLERTIFSQMNYIPEFKAQKERYDEVRLKTEELNAIRNKLGKEHGRDSVEYLKANEEYRAKNDMENALEASLKESVRAYLQDIVFATFPNEYVFILNDGHKGHYIAKEVEFVDVSNELEAAVAKKLNSVHKE